MYRGDESSPVRGGGETRRAVARVVLAVLFEVGGLRLLVAMPRPSYAQGEGRALITEVMADPREVSDQVGEWIEIANIGDAPLNLLDWVILAGDQRFEIMVEHWLAPGAYIVVARNPDPSVNGGVAAELSMELLSLRNERDHVRLLSPGGEVADEVAWGGETGLTAPEGASLERQGASESAQWGPAQGRWPGSAGDRGSPGAPYTPAPATNTPPAAPQPTDSATPSPLPSTNTPFPPTETASPTPPATASHTATTEPTATATMPPSDAPRILLSEVMANPAAVEDAAGEWLELYNGGDSAVNLRGWLLTDLDTDRHAIASDVWIGPGAYLVLGRNGDVGTNGGAAVAYVYAGLALANETDELVLVTPWGAEVDRLRWGEGTSLRVRKGASLERTGFGQGDGWVSATRAWAGSAGDLGSPGAPFVAPSPTSTPTEIPVHAAHWPVRNAPSSLAIDEVFADGSEHEFVALVNASSETVDLNGWALGDAERPGDGEGMYALPAGWALHPGQVFIVARNGSAFTGRWGIMPHAEIEESDASIATLVRRPDLATGSFALNDDGDEVVLLSPGMELADAVAWADGAYSDVRLGGRLDVRDGYSLQRAPGFRFEPFADVRYRFLSAPPAPAASRVLPEPSRAEHPSLGDGMFAVWGSLGAQSNFSREGHAPPHVVAAMAAAGGLDFVAVADAGVVHDRDVVRAASSIIALPAWEWRNADGAEAVVYGEAGSGVQSWADLREFLDSRAYVAQAQAPEPPAIRNLVAIGADHVSPADTVSLLTSWETTGRPCLPAGNSVPAWEGVGADAPRYTGLAVSRLDEAGVLEAVAARRGWLTSSPGLWLTMRTRDGLWMGQSVSQRVDITLDVQCGDAGGDVAGLTLWQDGRAVRRLDQCVRGQVWTVTLPAEPGSFLYATATQLDGDFAVTAPIFVERVAGESTQPAPDAPAQEVQRTEEARGGEASRSVEDAVAVQVEQGQMPGPPGSLAEAKLQGLGAAVEFRAQVVAPPGLYNASIYVAEPAAASPDVGGLGMQVYLRNGDYAALAEGDWVLVRGRLHSFRGELEAIVEDPGQIWRYEAGEPLQPLVVRAYDVGEALEGRLVTFRGDVVRWQGDSIYLCDPERPEDVVRVTVRSSLKWRRPYVNVGERWQATGIVSQFAKEHPWNGGYRLLVRYPTDLVRLPDR